MTNIIGTLIYKITGDTSALETNLANSKKQVVQTGDSFVKMGNKIKTVSTTIISGVLVKSLIQASSRLQELDNKFNTVFKGMEIQTKEFVDEYSKATSRGVIDTKEFLATQQDLRTGYGDNIEAAAKYSQAVVGITNDLASFSNVPIKEAMAAMQSGLSYQFEALRRLGVSLSVATIEQGDYAKSINKSWLEMTNLEKQEAVLSGVVSQSKNALHQNIQLWTDYNYKLGDAALTSDSFANSSQGMLQSLEDTKAEIGNNLIPIASLLSSTVLNISRGFNALPNGLQLATTAVGVFGIALKTLSTGPIGIAIGAIGALTVLLSNIKTSNEKLTEATTTLSEQSSLYSTLTKKLTGNTQDLTKEEKALLEVRRDLAKAQIEGSLAELSNAYEKQEDKIDSYTNKLRAVEGEYEAFKLAREEGIDAVKEKFNSLLLVDELDSKERAMLNALQSIASDVSMNLYKINDTTFDKFYADVADKYEEKMDELAKMENPLKSSINEIALSVSNGIIDISKYKTTNKGLYDAIMEVVDSLQEEKNNQDAANTSTKEAINLSTEYKNKIFENIAAKQEEKENFKNAAALKKVILENEKKDAIRKLAQDYELLGKDEDINNLSIAQLKERISANKAATQELNELNIYYNQEKEKLDKEANDKELAAIKEKEDKKKEIAKTIEDNNKKYSDQLSDQNVAINENKAAELESVGKFQEAYNIRKQLLEDEYTKEKEILNKKIEDGTATNQALLDLDKYYENEKSVLLDTSNKAEEKYNKEKNEKLEKERKETSKKYLDLIEKQSTEIKNKSATELESLGYIEEAYDIRKQLISDEYDKEKEILNKKIEDGEATNEDLINLDKYYTQKQVDLYYEKNEKLKENEDKTQDEINKKKEKALADNIKSLNSFMNQFKSMASEISSYLDSLSEKQLDDLEKQKNQKLEDLGLAEETQKETLQREYNEAIKNGDLKLANEKQRALEKIKVEEEFDEKKKKIEIEQAKRNKEIKKYEASISTLQAVIGFLADPGDWQGIALSAMAAATGAAQIAAIEATPLPSYDVGAFNITEDHIANIHQGEIIVPPSMSDSIRKGEAYLGKNENSNHVAITIINNTGAQVETSQSENGNIKEYKIMIGKVVNTQINEGRFDSALSSRYGIRRDGYNA
ncbi:MAG: hypothetical protein ACPKOI_03480 [Pleomorphochaeta sp.]